MINSLCGSMAMKRENSCSQLVQQTSPKNHHHDNQSNQSSFPSITSSELSKNNNMLLLPNELQQLDFDQLQTTLAPPSLDFPATKFDLDDRDHDHDHPDAALWDSLLQFEATDFMVMSPMPNADLSPPPAPQSQPQGFNNYVPAHLGTLNPGASSKGKGLSPLHKVFSSVNNQYMQHPESFAVPAIEELLLDYQQALFEEGGYSNSSTTTASTSNNNSDPSISGSMMIPNSLSFCDLVIRDEDNNAEGDNRGATLSQQLEQERQRERANQPSHLNPLPFASDHEQDSGLQLVHLLLACAEAVSKEEYMVARRYLHHLNRVVSPLGDSMQRVASCFTEALSARLAATLATSKPPPSFPPNSLEVLKIYQIVYQACPYVKFAHFTANQAIFEAFESEERVHVIDLDILQGDQWPAFMQALSARPGGAPFLRITGVGPSIDTVQETGRCLRELAYSLHVPFEFHAVGEQLEDLEPQMLHRRVGEALAVNSVNRLHRVPPHRLGALLSMLRDQAPSIVTLVEQEASHNGPYFLGRFLEALHYYSAIFDSLDATFPSESAQRMKVEQYIFAPEIRNIVASEGAERTERHERLDKWRKAMEGKGFRGVPLSANAVTQSKILLGLYSCDGYRLTEDRGCLLLGWQDRPLIAASAWRC